jgi:phosphotransferase system enzyme I (PtsP)
LRAQVRALLKAAGGRELKLMLPMVTELGEITQARELIDQRCAISRATRHLLPNRVEGRRDAGGAGAAVAAG